MNRKGSAVPARTVGALWACGLGALAVGVARQTFSNSKMGGRHDSGASPPTHHVFVARFLPPKSIL